MTYVTGHRSVSDCIRCASKDLIQCAPKSLSFAQYQQAGAPGNVGTLMVGARLKGAELLKAWLAVILFTLLAILVNMGNLLLSYLNQKVLMRDCCLAVH